MNDHCWIIWDMATDRQAGVNSYFTQEQANNQIAEFKARRLRGGRPDIDPTSYVARRHNHLILPTSVIIAMLAD